MCKHVTIETKCPLCQKPTRPTRSISKWCADRYVRRGGCRSDTFGDTREEVECVECKDKQEVVDEINRRRQWEISYPVAAELLESHERRTLKDAAQQTDERSPTIDDNEKSDEDQTESVKKRKRTD
ncbi:hypothetical protein FPOA_07043 [Fusarium poae]|uniref:Uncharacterized protein n=1 Tax=Fusarium poae TaxID=36050 RepID=A0A1B8AK87_FUSPO|nr:hypothetical protein FPOA_07043 [Fusarium poae]